MEQDLTTLTVVCPEQDSKVLNIPIHKDSTVETFKDIISIELGGILHANEIFLWCNKELENPKVIGSYQLTNKDLIFLFRNYSKHDPQYNMLKRMMLTSLPSDKANDPLIQQEMSEMLQGQQIDESLKHAMEHYPESFVPVIMLYINCIVNNVQVQAFVDSGAQQTIMSRKCAKRCGLWQLVDLRYSGYATGIGRAPILGRIHYAPITIGPSFLISSITVLKGGVDFLIGLDLLRKYQCSIDLKTNVLHIGNNPVPFLAEKDLPKDKNHDKPQQKTEQASKKLKSYS